MPATVKDGAIQRASGCEEQSVGEVIWEVLSGIVVACVDSDANTCQHWRR